MTKRILSMVLSLALLLSCVSGITLFTMAEDTLPDPLASFDTATGEFVNSGFCPGWGGESWISPPVEAIGETGEYGIKLTGDWQGGWFGGEIFTNAKADTAYTMVIEYYIDKDFAPQDHTQMFRYQSYSGMSAENSGVTVTNGYHDVFTDSDHLVSRKSGLLFHNFTEAEMAAIGTGDMRFYVGGCADGANVVYIQSLKLIETQYVDVITNPGYSFYDFEETVHCDYYPDVTAPTIYDMGYTDEESPFRQYKVFGSAFSQSATENKPVYIKFYTNEANANTTIAINTYQAYGMKEDGTYAATHSALLGYASPNVTVKDGVGGVLLPETCFRNGANAGSFRLNVSELEKLTRVEVYDVKTYCDEANATDEMKAELHTAMLAGLINVEKDGYVAPTVDAPGATGVITCATCGAELSASTEIPQLTTYAQIDFNHADGAETTAIKSLGGLSTPVQIPGTDYYGAKLTYQNNNISFALDTFGITAADIANGTKLAITYEYYASPAWGDNDRLTLQTTGGYNLAAYGAYTRNTYDSLSINKNNPLTRGKLALVTYTVGDGVTYTVDNAGNIGNNTQAVAGVEYDTVATANALVNGAAMNMLIWNSMEASTGDESKAMYIKSITICNAAELDEPGASADGSYYIDFVGVATNPYYPDYLTAASNGLTAPTNRDEYYPEDTAHEYVRFGYMHVQMPEAILSNEETLQATPVKLVIERKAGSDINHIYYQYQVGGPGPVWSGENYVDFNEEGVYETYLWNARFFNSLNANSSIRLRDTIYEQTKDGDTITYNETLGDEFDGIASIKVYDLSEDCEQYHDLFTEANGNLIRSGRVEPTYEAVGSTGTLVCAHCGEIFEEAKEIPMLVDADYAQMDFSTGTTILQSVKSLSAIDGDTSTVPVAIPGMEGVYALEISKHNSGVKFNLSAFGGYTAEDIENGLELAISVEYYLPADFPNDGRITFDGGNGNDKIMGFYTSYANATWDCTVVNPNTPLVKDELGLATFKVGKDVTYITGPGQFGAANKFSESVEVGTEELALDLVNGEEITLRVWKPDTAPSVYIKSITIYDAKDLDERETVESNMDYIDTQVEFAESPIYYPQYSIKGYSDGLSCVIVPEDVIYAYYSVSRALIKEGEAYHPVMIRFTFKEDTELTSFSWSYQGAHYTGDNGTDVWSHLTTDITGSVVEVLLEDAVFENRLNDRGSFRLSNDPEHGGAVADDLLKVEVLAIVDKTELEEAIANAEAAGQYKSKDTVAVLNAALAKAEAVAEDNWSTEADVAEAIDALEAAVEQLVDCDHQSGTELVGYVEETCLEPGYTGDQACKDCGFVAEGDEGEEIPAHETRTINVKETSCKEAGYTGDLWCDVDQKIVKSGTSVMALPHTWDDGKVTKPATKDERGEITKTCEKCGSTMITRFDFVAESGDVDGSGTIDSTDARLVLQFAVKKISGDALDLDVADVDGSGTIDSTDARLILQLAVGKIKEFPTVK